MEIQISDDVSRLDSEFGWIRHGRAFALKGYCELTFGTFACGI
jgi:hypothetical protein